MIKNFFVNTNAVSLSDKEIAYYRVNREKELTDCKGVLINGDANILIYGTRGVGKTFFARILEGELKNNENIFTTRVDLIHYMRDFRSISAFPRAILDCICRDIWINIFNRKSDELFRFSTELSTFNNLGLSKEQSVLLDVFRFVISEKKKIKSLQFTELGFSSGIRAGIKDGESTEMVFGDFLSIEYITFLSKIQTDVLHPLGYKSSIIICDEANRLPILQQIEILENYLGLLMKSGFAFVFIAGLYPDENLSIPHDVFGKIFEMKGFSEKEYVGKLFKKYGEGSGVVFTDDAVDVIWEAFQGDPRFSLEAARFAYQKIVNATTKLVDAKAAALACFDILQRQKTSMLIREKLEL